jgi:hypothetical protein
MDKLTFFRGLLFALRQHRKQFEAEGDRFHRAFASTIELAKSEHPELVANIISLEFDPIFGVYTEASEMLLEGEQDLVLSLMNPRLGDAVFKIDPIEAAEELSTIPNAEWFKELGTHFHNRLDAVADA